MTSTTQESWKEFGRMIDRLIRQENLTRDEARKMFDAVLRDEQPELQQGAFLAALTAKPPTPQEMAGAWEAIYELDTVRVSPEVCGPLVENCGTGMDSIKTFNISTASSIVAASAGVCMAKHGARAITSRCGTVDMLERLGIDVECQPALVKRSIEEAGIGIFNGMSEKVHPAGLFRILSRIRFGTVLNIAGSLANPAAPSRAVRGVYSEEMVVPIAQTMREIGYERALVVHGKLKGGPGGMDELSTLGPTVTAELDQGQIRQHVIWPKDVGLSQARMQDLLLGADLDEEVFRMIRVLAGDEMGARRDAVLLNASAVLYVAEKAEDLKEGVRMAAELIDTGRAVEKLWQWTGSQSSGPSGSRRFEELAESAGIT